ncbi:hypothetical protein VNO77_15529 [Canavalia gladiata]|uniref:Uncharacterized protein n=1 Tax=Canavalia gladiata TaxID=3824 RepID=A0AAN9M2T0_CANGL
MLRTIANEHNTVVDAKFVPLHVICLIQSCSTRSGRCSLNVYVPVHGPTCACGDIDVHVKDSGVEVEIPNCVVEMQCSHVNGPFYSASLMPCGSVVCLRSSNTNHLPKIMTLRLIGNAGNANLISGQWSTRYSPS